MPLKSFRGRWNVLLPGVISLAAIGAVGIVPRSLEIAYLWFLALFVCLSVILNALKRVYVLNRLLMAIVAASFFLIPADLFMRSLLRHRLYYRPHEMFVQRHRRIPSLTRYKRDVRYDGMIYGDLAAMAGEASLREPRHMIFNTDRLGFRSSSSVLDRDLDILVIGDSVAVGDGVSQTDVWVDRLGGITDLNIYNLSMGGNSPWHGYMNLLVEWDAMPLKSGTVVLFILFSGNDLDEHYGDVYTRDTIPWGGALSAYRVSWSMFRNRSAIRQLLRNIAQGFYARAYDAGVDGVYSPKSAVISRQLPEDERRILFFRDYYLRGKRSETEISSHKNWPRLKETLRAMYVLCEENDLLLYVVLVPSKEEVLAWIIEEQRPWQKDPDPSGMSLALRRFCAENGTHFLDVAPQLREASIHCHMSMGEFLWWLDDTHLNRKGNRVLADVIAGSL